MELKKRERKTTLLLDIPCRVQFNFSRKCTACRAHSFGRKGKLTCRIRMLREIEKGVCGCVFE